MRYVLFTISALMVMFIASTSLAAEFPYRKDYPEIQIVELEDLKAGYDSGEFVIVDVRSALEFNTIRPEKSFHIPLSNARFVANLKTFSAEYSDKKIAVYCNGITCLKSYKAAQDATEAGMNNVYSFDAGIPAWAKNYPADTLLLGKKITDPEKQLIPKSEFEKHLLDFDSFKQLATDTNTVVIDARDAKQRTHELPDVQGIKRISLDKFIKNVINKGNMKDKKILVFDQVGKQVRWLMYNLVDQGYTDFYFLKGGATSVLKKQEYR